MSGVQRAGTPAALLAALEATDSTRPRLTWYDDAPGRTQGERIELSARVIATWVAKAANLLVDELDVERGDVVRLDLPAHWRTVYWAFACWRAGAVADLDSTDGAARAIGSHADPPAVLVTCRAPETVAAATVGVSLPALARRWTGIDPLPDGVIDEAADLASQPDVFEPFDHPEPGDAAVQQEGMTAADLMAAGRALAAQQGWARSARVLIDGAQPRWWLAVLAAWSVDGSVVLVRDPDPARQDERTSAERVTNAYDPTGTPASRP